MPNYVQYAYTADKLTSKQVCIWGCIGDICVFSERISQLLSRVIPFVDKNKQPHRVTNPLSNAFFFHCTIIYSLMEILNILFSDIFIIDTYVLVLHTLIKITVNILKPQMLVHINITATHYNVQPIGTLIGIRFICL